MHNHDIIIDKSSFKIMKYLYKHGEVELGEIEHIFGKDNTTILFYLCHMQHVAHRHQDGHLSFDVSYIDSNDKFVLLPPAKAYVENRHFQFMKWLFPLVISVFSLALSVVSIVISVF